MYNRYPTDKGAFHDLYQVVEQEEIKPVDKRVEERKSIEKVKKQKPKPLDDNKFKGIGLIGLGLVALLLMDTDDEEKLIILALIFLLGL